MCARLQAAVCEPHGQGGLVCRDVHVWPWRAFRGISSSETIIGRRVFYGADDYHRYLQDLAEQATKFGRHIHACCLMTNHVHLLTTPERKNSAGLMMKHLEQRYVQHINRRYQRTGTLWEGRFRSCLAQSENYVLACYRYIELNPVRAGMVTDPGEYPWSSYRHNGTGALDPLLTPHDDYRSLGADENERQAKYRTLFRAHLDSAVLDDIRNATNGNYALGNDRFKEEIERMLKRRAKPGKPGRPEKKHGTGEQ